MIRYAALSDAERRQIDAQRAAQEIVGGDPLVPFDLAGVAREIVSLRAENERLRKALELYGFHYGNCPAILVDATWPCECGWEEVAGQTLHKDGPS